MVSALPNTCVTLVTVIDLLCAKKNSCSGAKFPSGFFRRVESLSKSHEGHGTPIPVSTLSSSTVHNRRVSDR